jgi:hypothetical protein
MDTKNIQFLIEMLGKLDDNQAKAGTDIKAWREEMDAKNGSRPSRDESMVRNEERQPQRDCHRNRTRNPSKDDGLPTNGGASRRRRADLIGQETGGGTKNRGPRRKLHSNAGRRTE